MNKKLAVDSNFRLIFCEVRFNVHINQVESLRLFCLGCGDGLKNGKKLRFAQSGSLIFSDPITII